MHEEYRGISDIFHGLTNGKANFGFVHPNDYWDKDGTVEAEAWAQYGRTQFENNPNVQRMIKTLFPSFSVQAEAELKRVIEDVEK